MEREKMKMKIKKISGGFYEFIEAGQIKYTATKGGTGWNLYNGDDTLKGLLDTYNTLKEIKVKLCD